jgi:hypothetical protein
MDTELQYFEKSSDNINLYKTLFDRQSQEVCQHKISKKWVKASIDNFTFCYAFISQKAQIGRRSLKKIEDKYTLKAFVVCRVLQEENQILKIDLICSKSQLKLGKILLELVEEKAKQMNVKVISLSSLPSVSLRKWYKNLGYVTIDFIDHKDGTLKACSMQKLI